MSMALRILLCVFSIGSFFYIIEKIKKAQIRIEDSLFWILFWGMIVALSLAPQMVYFFTRALKVDSPVNFVYLVFIFILLIRVFTMSLKMSQLENKIKNLTQEIAMNQKKYDDDREREEDIKRQRSV